MTRRPTPRNRGGRNEPAVIEWLGGTVFLPGYVTGEGEAYRPAALFWMGADGALLGSTVARPGEIALMASDSLRRTIEEPEWGQPHAPTRVRVASAELADALRAGHPGLDVVCAPTPELDETLAELRAHLDEEGLGEQSYLAPGVEPAAMAALFKTAAALFRAQPWKVVPDDQSLISVTIEQLGVRDAAMSVIGQMGQSLGFVLFSGLDNFEAYLDGTGVLEPDEEPELPPHLALSFERGAELAPELHKEIAEYQWDIAAGDAYPLLIVVGDESLARPPSAADVILVEAIARALTAIVADEKALRAAWAGGAPVCRTVALTTHQGEMDVTLRAPYARAHVVFEGADDVLSGLAALARDHDEIDPHARELLEAELLRRFAASPEAGILEDIEDVGACRLVMDVAAGYVGQTIATLGPSDLRTILFEIIPRKVFVQPAEARSLVEALRAFYRYLDRELGLVQAASCLRVLGGKAIEKLENALSDPGNFGMAKSVLMAGAEAGFDVESREGVQAWMASIQGKPLPQGFPVPGLDAPAASPRKPAKPKKNKREAAHKARTRNR
jgi:hypothetical protein